MSKIQEILYLLYLMMVSIWNDKIDDSVNALTMDFHDVASLATLMERLTNHVFLPIAGLLATVFLIVRFCSLALDSRGQLDVWGIAKLFIRCFLCMALIQNTYQIILELVRASIKIVDSVAYWAGGTSVAAALQFRFSKGSSSTVLTSDPFDTLGLLLAFVLIIFMIIFVIATAIMSWVIYIMIVRRIFKIVLYGTFATVSLITCIGGPEISRIGFTYAKYMIGLIFSNDLIYVALIFAGLVRDSLFSISVSNALSATDSSSCAIAILVVCFEMIAYMAFCAVTVAGADRTMQRTFGL